MKKIFVAFVFLITATYCFGQYNFGFYAGWQSSSSHQKIVRDDYFGSFVYRHYLPDVGFLAGFTVTRPLGNYFTLSNNTGYSQINLSEDNPHKEKALLQRFTLHFATTEINASLNPFAAQSSVWINLSISVGGGIKVRMDNADPSKTFDSSNGNPLWPYLKTGLTFDVGRLSLSPNIHIPLAPFYKERNFEEFQFDLYLRTWGINVGYRFTSN